MRRRSESWQLLRADFRLAMRGLASNRGFATAVILTMALGIAAIASAFTAVDAILIKPLPFDESGRLVTLGHTTLDGHRAGISSGLYLHYRGSSRTLDELALYDQSILNLTDGASQAERIQVTLATPEFFRVLPVTPIVGRVFTESDGTPGFMDMTWNVPILISEALWRRRYGADPTIVGRLITINDMPRLVLGVLPARLAFPNSQNDVWMLFMPSAATARVGDFSYSAIGLRKPGFAVEDIARDLTGALASIQGQYPDATPERLRALQLRPTVVTLKKSLVGDLEAILWVLLGGMALLFAVGCSNVANLFLVRSEHRKQEIAVRLALGAQPRDVMRLVRTEAALLCLFGAGIGCLIANWVLAGVVRFAPVELLRPDTLQVGARTMVVAVALSALAAWFFAELSMLRSSRQGNPGLLLRGAGRGVIGAGNDRIRRALVASQLALAVMLLVGSGLCLRSFSRMTNVNLGFDASNVITAEIGIPYSKADEHQQIYSALLERVRNLPGVLAVGAGSSLPLTEAARTYEAVVEPDQGMTTEYRNDQPVVMKFFTPGYVQAMRLAVIEGVDPTAHPTEVPWNSVLISHSLARRLFPSGNTVGSGVRRVIPSADAAAQPRYTIAGVVGDVRETSLRDAPTEVIYIPVLPHRVDPWIIPTEMVMVVRSEPGSAWLAGSLRQAVGAFDRSISVSSVRELEAVASSAMAQTRFLAMVLLSTAFASLLLGAIGVYGVVSYTVRQRTREIAIRVALGASPRSVVTMILGGSAALAAAGVASGLVIASVGTRALASVLFEVSPTDFLTFAFAAVSLILVSVFASLLPARAAARTYPTVALRGE